MEDTFLKLSDMSKEKRAEYEKQLESIYTTGINGFVFRKPFKEFDDYNLKYSSEHLAQIGISIIMLPIEFMQKYVDGIIFNKLKHKRQELLKVDYSFDYNTLNTSSIGNIAYISLNINDKIIEKKCNKILHKIFVKFYKEVLDEIYKNTKGEC